MSVATASGLTREVTWLRNSGAKVSNTASKSPAAMRALYAPRIRRLLGSAPFSMSSPTGQLSVEECAHALDRLERRRQELELHEAVRHAFEDHVLVRHAGA